MPINTLTHAVSGRCLHETTPPLVHHTTRSIERTIKLLGWHEDHVNRGKGTVLPVVACRRMLRPLV